MIPSRVRTSQRPQRPRSATFAASTIASVGIQRSAVLITMLVTIAATTTMTTVAAFGDSAEEDEYYRDRRAAAKPWMMKEFQLFEFSDGIHQKIAEIAASQGFDGSVVPRTVFVSPFTILVVGLAVANIWSWLAYHLSGTWVEASHILVKDTGPKTLKALNGLRDQLGKDAKLFGLTAKQYSQCPSAEQNGDLGRFAPGVMAPPFDKACFDPATPVGETIGPVQTQFGYHLIYLRKRKY